MKINTKKLLLSVSSIILGSFIYIFWRPENLIIFNWLKELHIYNFIINLRNTTRPLSTFFPNWSYYSLPNGLWLFGGIIFFSTIWDSKKYQFQQLLWTTIFLIIAFGFELAQYFSIIPGTYDINDILFIIIGCLVSTVFIKINFFRR